MSVQTTVATPRREQRALSLRDRDRILSIASPIGLLLVWEIAARAGAIDTRFFPAPSSVLALLIEMLKSGELLTHTGTSLVRLGWGILVSVTKGNYWFLTVALLVYVVAFGKIGCLPPADKSH